MGPDEGSRLLTCRRSRHGRDLEFQLRDLGTDQADRYTDEIRDACYALARDERRGRTVDVRPGYMKISTGSHVLFYRERNDKLEIIRVLHIRMDANRHL